MTPLQVRSAILQQLRERKQRREINRDQLQNLAQAEG